MPWPFGLITLFKLRFTLNILLNCHAMKNADVKRV